MKRRIGRGMVMLGFTLTGIGGIIFGYLSEVRPHQGPILDHSNFLYSLSTFSLGVILFILGAITIAIPSPMAKTQLK